MKLADVFTFADPAASIASRLMTGAVALVTVLIVILVLWWSFIGGPAHDRAEAAKARATATFSQGDQVATAAAAKAAADEAGRQEDRANLDQENKDEILSQPGASLPVDPAVRDATLRVVCRRAVYHDDRACVRLRQQEPAQPH